MIPSDPPSPPSEAVRPGAPPPSAEAVHPIDSGPQDIAAGPPPGAAPAPEADAVRLGAGFDFTDPNSPLAPYYLRASHLVAIALLGLIFFYFSNVVPLGHTDVWAHLKFGAWIVERGELPPREPFSPFSDQDTEYFHFQWLAQSAASLAYQAGAWLAGSDPGRQTEGGVHALRTAHAVVVTLRFLVLLIAFSRLSGSLPLACAGIVVVLLPSFGPTGVQRPQALGELFFALVLLGLVRPVMSVRAMVVVPLLFALWANCHGSFLAGLMLVGVFLAGRGLDVCRAAGKWNPLRALGDAQVRRLLAVLAVSAALVAVLNPHGPALYRHALGLARNPNIMMMTEWLPLPFSLDIEGGHWTYWGLLVLLLLSQAVSPVGLTLGQMLVVLTFGVLPLVQQRMMTWWVMLAPALLVQLWSATGAALAPSALAAGGRQVAGRWPWLHWQSVPSFRKTLLAALLLVLAALYSGPGSWALAGRPRPLGQAVGPQTPWRLSAQIQAPPGAKAIWPELAQALAENYPGGRFQGRIFASEVLGDYLLWSLPRENAVLVYSHVHVFPASHWEEYTRVLYGNPGWWEVLDRHRVNLVIVESDVRKALADELRKDPDWLVVPDAANKGNEVRPLVALRRRPL